jgi:hypothetical protein
VDINTSDTSTPTHNQISGPITRARAQLNNQVSSFLASYSSYLDNRNMCSVLLLRNDGQEQNGVAFASATFGFQNSSSLWRPPRPRMDFDSGVQILSGKLLESISYASNLKSISCRSRPQSLFWCRDLFLPTVLRDLILAYWAVYLSPIRMRPRVGARPSHPEVVLPHL